jgi:hypothetical protein
VASKLEHGTEPHCKQLTGCVSMLQLSYLLNTLIEVKISPWLATKPPPRAHQGREIIVLHKNFHIFHNFLHKIHIFHIPFHRRVPQLPIFCGPNAL